MLETISYRNIWRVSYPLILSFLAITLINVTDIAFMGRLGEIAIGATGLGGLYVLVFVMASMGLSIGAQIIMARYNGEKALDKIGLVFDHLLYVQLLLGILLSILHFTVGEPLLRLMVSSDAVYDGIIEYLFVRMLGLLPTLLGLSYRAFLTGISLTRPIGYASGIMAVANFGLNYILVFGKFGFPAMGIAGAAIASVLSEMLSLAYLVLWIRFKKLAGSHGIHLFPRIKWAPIVNIFRISAPIMVQNLMAICTWFIFFLLIEGLGERALAVSNVVRSGYMVLMIPVIGIGQATQTLVSTLIGQGGTHLVRILVLRLISISFLSALALVVLVLSVPSFLLTLFTNDSTLVTASIPILSVVAFGILLFSVAIVLISVVSGSGNTLITMFIEMATIAFYMLYILLSVKVFEFPLVKIWYAEPIYFLCLGTFSALYLWTGKWKNAKVHE
ncbi:MAG: hypothetical protein RL266_1825 [Bacteroidota bacterium]|jgi:putative MATE family efflux protein